MNQQGKNTASDLLNGFVGFINSINNISRIKTGSGRGRPLNSNIHLIEIKRIVLVAGLREETILSLKGFNLKSWEKNKKLSFEEMDNLFDFVNSEFKSGSFEYCNSNFDLTIIDGNSHVYSINWNGIKFNENGGNTMPDGFSRLIEYCDFIINN
jgi:hypothetical protein